jgi:hypothetical protein
MVLVLRRFRRWSSLSLSLDERGVWYGIWFIIVLPVVLVCLTLATLIPALSMDRSVIDHAATLGTSGAASVLGGETAVAYSETLPYNEVNQALQIARTTFVDDLDQGHGAIGVPNNDVQVTWVPSGSSGPSGCGGTASGLGAIAISGSVQVNLSFLSIDVSSFAHPVNIHFCSMSSVLAR